MRAAARGHEGSAGSTERLGERGGLQGDGLVRVDHFPTGLEQAGERPDRPGIHGRLPRNLEDRQTQTADFRGEPGTGAGDQGLPYAGCPGQAFYKQADLLLTASVFAGRIDLENREIRHRRPRPGPGLEQTVEPASPGTACAHDRFVAEQRQGTEREQNSPEPRRHGGC